MSATRYWVLPLAAAGLLGVALAASRWSSSPEAARRGGEPRPEQAEEWAPQSGAEWQAAGAGGARPAARPAQAGAPSESSPAVAQGSQLPPPAGATAPLPPREPFAPQLPLEPGRRYERLMHLAEQLEQEVERLEQEQLQAEARGQREEARRLELLGARQRARLQVLRTEAETLAGQDERTPLR